MLFTTSLPESAWATTAGEVVLQGWVMWLLSWWLVKSFLPNPAALDSLIFVKMFESAACEWTQTHMMMKGWVIKRGSLVLIRCRSGFKQCFLTCLLLQNVWVVNPVGLGGPRWGTRLSGWGGLKIAVAAEACCWKARVEKNSCWHWNHQGFVQIYMMIWLTFTIL